jgi:hypothetical protein
LLFARALVAVAVDEVFDEDAEYADEKKRERRLRDLFKDGVTARPLRLA